MQNRDEPLTMSRPVSADATWSVEAFTVGDIRDRVEPVTCTGDDDEHEPTEAAVAETGVGFVVYRCPECGFRACYRHGRGDEAPCCGPRG